MSANLLDRSLRNPQLIISAWQLVDIGAASLTLFITTHLFHADFEPKHWRLLLTVIASMLVIYSLSDLYFRRRTRFLLEDAYLLFIEWGKVLMVILALGYLSGAHNEFSRSMILSWALAAYFAQVIVHIGIQAMLRSLRRHGITSRRALIVGAGLSLSRFAKLLDSNPWLGIDAVGYVCEDDWLKSSQNPNTSQSEKDEQAAIRQSPLQRLGHLRDINALVRAHSIDDVYIALPIDQFQTLENFAVHLLNCPATVSWVPGISMTGAMSTRADTIAGHPLISLSDSPLRGGKQTLKRVLDLTLSLLGIVLLSPLMLFIAVLVKATSKGPVLFKQQRRGIGGSTIEVWKFRTMWELPEGEQPKQATADDERITPLGKVLRHWSLDELPQFFNVIQGQLSLVGPRPHALWLDNEFEHEIDIYRQRNKVKPGITGLAQVNGHRGETETREKMELRLRDDIYYINHWSIWLDIKILLLTIPAIFSRTNAI